MEFNGFDWDNGTRSKCKMHGVSITEIEILFYGSPLVGPDIEHSDQEQRLRAVGVTRKKRNLFIVFTLRKKGEELLIRPISARYMHKKEVKSREKEISKVQD